MLFLEFDGKKEAIGQLEGTAKFVKEPPKAFWTAVGQTVRQGVIDNFRYGGDLATRQKWKPLKSGKPSKLTKTGRLREVVFQSDEGGAEVGTNMIYGRIHHFGGRAGRNLRAQIPARPWLTLSEETKLKIASLIRNNLMK